jgi:hypothetical protein
MGYLKKHQQSKHRTTIHLYREENNIQGFEENILSKARQGQNNIIFLSQTTEYYHRVETYRDVTSVPTFFVRMLGKLLDACI